MFDYYKALHIIFVVSWFAGLFYMVRLFIYRAEAEEMEEPKRSILSTQYKIMQKRLWSIIAWPAMILTTVFGVLMVWEVPTFLYQSYFHVKLGFVFVLYIYHFCCHAIFKQQKGDKIRFTSTQLRIWNEVATLLLVSVVFIIVLKHSLNFIWGTVGFMLVGVLLMLGIRLYKLIRKKNQ